MSRRLVFALLLLLPSAAPAREVAGPVAVMPFQNVGAELSLEWLSVGIAETMISDLEKLGAVKVVERAQLDRALAEIALQGQGGTEVATAAKVGKMVGARTIVVGGYQSAGQKLRITARFVEVETGLVLDTAKVTGPVTRIFALQDDIVAQLLGRPKKAYKPPRQRKAPSEKTVGAYRLWAMSLTTASDAQRAGYLQKAVALDPDFVYALEDLEALRAKMGRLRQTADRASGDRASVLRAKLDAGQIEAMEVVELLGLQLQSRRYRALLADAMRIRDRTWPQDEVLMRPAELAGFYAFTALVALKQTDQALQLGEAFLSQHPTSMYFRGMELQMQTIIDQKLRHERQRAELPGVLAEIQAELDDIDAQLRENEAAHRRLETEASPARRQQKLAQLEARSARLPVRRLAIEQRVCIEHYRHGDFEGAVEACSAYLDRHGTAEGDDAALYRSNVRFNLVLSLWELGYFERLREAAEPLGRHPDYGVSVRAILDQAPVD